jgi:hypothetical protein
MKKYSFFMLLLFVSTVCFGQSLDDINKMLLLQQNKKAREGIDKFLSDAKNATKAEGWFYKGRIYNNISKDSGTSSADALKLKNDAFEAFKKYQQMDAKDLSFIAENHASYFDLYNGYFDIGAKEFNNKNFPVSLEGFKNALLVEDYVKAKGYEYNGFKFPALDTSLITNAAIAATQAKDEAAAASFYRKLTDANISGEAYLNIYQYLADYYLRVKDETNANAILDKARTLYPENEYWTEIELDKVSKTGDKEALFAKYDELMKKYPAKYSLPFNYAAEVFNYLYIGDKKPANAEALKGKLTDVLKTAINLDKGIDAKMLMTRHLYNAAYDYQDSSKSIKGAKPADVKKRNDLKAQFLKSVDDAIPYGVAVADYFAALPTLKPVQKANYKNMLDIVSQLYSTKGDVKKSAEYDKKKAAVEKM